MKIITIKIISVFDNKNNYIEYESKGDRNKNLSVKECLNMIRPYLSNIINDHKTHGKLKFYSGNKVIDCKTLGQWKTHLSITINFVSSKDSDEIRAMHMKSDNIDILMGSETDETIKGLFKSLLQRYQEGLEQSMKGSEFVFNSVDLLEYKLNKIYFGRRGRSYIDSPKWLKNKKTTINPKNNDDNCFQYALNVASDYQNIEKTRKEYQKLSLLLISMIGKIQTFHHTHQKADKKFGLNNKSIALNILFVPYNTEEIRLLRVKIK